MVPVDDDARAVWMSLSSSLKLEVRVIAVDAKGRRPGWITNVDRAAGEC